MVSGRSRRRTILPSIAGMTSCPCGMPDMRLSRQSFTSHQRNSEPVISGGDERPERRKDGLKRFLVIAFGRAANGRPSRDSSSWLTTLRLCGALRVQGRTGSSEGDPACPARPRSRPHSIPSHGALSSIRPDLYLCENTPRFPKRKRPLKEFNIGIMLSPHHAGRRGAWMNMETQVEDQFAKKDYKNGEYVCTIMFHS